MGEPENDPTPKATEPRRRVIRRTLRLSLVATLLLLAAAAVALPRVGETRSTTERLDDCEALQPASDNQQENVVACLTQVLVDAAIGISWPDGAITWSLGGDHPNSLRVIGDPLGGPQAAHDAVVTRTNEGTFLHFMDNNTFRGPARYVRYRLDLTARTAELVAAQTLECSYGEC